MLISFIVPFYGSVPLLKRCLDSLVAQTEGGFEVIVVDDRSPERAEELVAQYDSRFRYVLQAENKGPYQGRVRGVEEARGEYVVDIDCDDYVKPELAAELRKAIERDQADIVIYNVEQDYSGDIRPHWCRYASGVFPADEVLQKFVQKELQWNFWAKAIRRELFAKVWACEPLLHEARVLVPDDYCAILPVVMSCRKIGVIPYVGHRYWQSATSITHRIGICWLAKAIFETLAARRLILSFAKKAGVDGRMQNAARAVSRMILRWVYCEYKQSLKAKILGK